MCGAACAAGEVCTAGVCALSCAGGATQCGNACKDLQNDPANCGMCGTVCPAGQVCSTGACGLACAGGTTKCGNACKDLQNDPANCGMCGTACPAGQVCSAGLCGLTCSGGTTKCGNACKNLQNDAANCGVCGTACPAGQVCSAGVCSLQCAGGTTLCNGTCKNLQNDPTSCGVCGTVCAAGQVCTAGVCALSCGGGTTKCGNSCVSLQNDPANCGACGTVCGGGKACVTGTCQPLALFTFSGIQANLPIASLTGWTQCYLDTYANSATALTTIQTQCSQAKLLLGCRNTGATTLTNAANAPRIDVLFDTGTGNVTHDANGVSWYYNTSWSWGYAPLAAGVTRTSCDTTNVADPLRLCWHTSAGLINGGWRCGASTGLNADATHERIIFQAP
jgi:hypothetical protein